VNRHPFDGDAADSPASTESGSRFWPERTGIEGLTREPLNESDGRPGH
jgi:hypothetical protein